MKGKAARRWQRHAQPVSPEEVFANLRKAMHKEKRFYYYEYNRQKKCLEMWWREVPLFAFMSFIERANINMDMIKEVVFSPEILRTPNSFGDTEIIRARLYLNG